MEYRYDYDFAQLSSYEPVINLYAVPNGSLQAIAVEAIYTPTKNGEGFEAGSTTTTFDMQAGYSIASTSFELPVSEEESETVQFGNIKSYVGTNYGDLTWYSDAACTQAVDINEIVDLPLTEEGFTIKIYAKEEVPQYTVQLRAYNNPFASQSTSSSLSVYKGEVIDSSSIVTSNYTVSDYDWYEDRRRSISFDLSTPIESDMTIYGFLKQ